MQRLRPRSVYLKLIEMNKNQEVISMCQDIPRFVISGLILFAIPVIQWIPLAVCYGVFLYFGFSSLPGVQFVEQMKLCFVPVKFHPANKGYVRNVSIHSYT